VREIKQLVEFECSKEPIERTFTLNKVTGINKVSFIFMPGSQFDFKWFRFGKN
jgi:beta-galactosidase